MKFLNNVGKVVTKGAGRLILKTKKYSPEIFLVVGIGGVVVGTILACKATRELDDALDEVKTDIQNCVEKYSVTTEDGKVFPKDGDPDYRKEMAKTKIRGGFKIVRLYILPIAIEIAAISCLIAGHDILKKRNIGLAAAYKAVSDGFDKYRERVREEFGEDVDRSMRYGAKLEEVEDTSTDKDGKEVKKIIQVENIEKDELGYSVYARFFDCGSIYWTKDPETNLARLRQIQRYCNDKLASRGHLFLNEVYDELDIPRTKEGQIVGWVLGESGDDFVDFNIYDIKNEATRRFVNGDEANILLDFNVNGPIYDLI